MFKFDLTLDNLKRGLSNPFQLIDEIVLQHGYRIPSTVYNMKMGIGTNIFSKDWDLLIILDCCRVDALIELAPEYDFIGEVNPIRTVGGRRQSGPQKHSVQSTANKFKRQGTFLGQDRFGQFSKKTVPQIQPFWVDILRINYSNIMTLSTSQISPMSTMRLSTTFQKTAFLSTRKERHHHGMLQIEVSSRQKKRT